MVPKFAVEIQWIYWRKDSEYGAVGRRKRGSPQRRFTDVVREWKKNPTCITQRAKCSAN